MASFTFRCAQYGYRSIWKVRNKGERTSRSRPRSRAPDQVPEFRSRPLRSRPSNAIRESDVELGVRSIPVPYLFRTRSRPNKVLSTYSPCIIVGTSKRQSSFHALRIKYAIQTLRIRRHRNVQWGHVVLISSHMDVWCEPSAAIFR